MKFPVLVDCVPYHARLPKASCVDRWQKAQGVVLDGKGVARGSKALSNGARRGILYECMGCSVGQQRAKEATAAAAKGRKSRAKARPPKVSS